MKLKTEIWYGAPTPGERVKFEVIDFIEDKETGRKPWDKWFK